MKRKYLSCLLTMMMLCIAAGALAQSTKPTYKVTIPGFSVITASDCTMMPIGATGGVVTIVKPADDVDQQFNNDMKNKTKIATMDIVMYDARGNKGKTFHFTNLLVKSAVPNVSKISAFGLSFDNMTQN